MDFCAANLLNSLSPRAASSCAASCTRGASRSGPTTSSTTSPTSPSPSSRPRTTTTPSATACSRARTTPRCSTCRSPSQQQRRRLPRSTTAPASGGPHRAANRARRSSLARRALATLLRLEGHRRPGKAIVTVAGLLRRRQRQDAALLPVTPSTAPSKPSPRTEPHPAGHGDRHRQDLHRLPDHLAAVEVAGQKKRILFLADRNILVDQTKTTTSSPSARR
jgi:hypothetical protein